MTRFCLAVLALSAAALGVLAATPTPADRCRAAGYDTAVHMIQPDGHSREWLCYSLPSEDLSTPWRAKYLKEIGG